MSGMIKRAPRSEVERDSLTWRDATRRRAESRGSFLGADPATGIRAVRVEAPTRNVNQIQNLSKMFRILDCTFFVQTFQYG